MTKYSIITPLEMKNQSVVDLLYGVLFMMCKAGKPCAEIMSYIEQYESKYSEWWKYEIIHYLGKVKQLFLQ